MSSAIENYLLILGKGPELFPELGNRDSHFEAKGLELRLIIIPTDKDGLAGLNFFVSFFRTFSHWFHYDCLLFFRPYGFSGLSASPKNWFFHHQSSLGVRQSCPHSLVLQFLLVASHQPPQSHTALSNSWCLNLFPS